MAHKYGAKKVIVTEDGTMFEVEELKKHNITDVVGIKFDSKMEANYYKALKDQQRFGMIKEIELQPVFILQEKPKIKYIADFKVTYPDGRVEIIDVKGHMTTAFKIKLRLFQSTHKDHKLVLVNQIGRIWHKSVVCGEVSA